MHRAIRQFPDEPGVHRAKQQLPVRGFTAGIGNMLENPFNLAAGKIGVNYQTGLASDRVCFRRLRQLAAPLGRSPALPHDGGRHGPACLALPNDGGLPLVGDAQRRHPVRLHLACGQRPPRGIELRMPDLVCVLLHPTGVRVSAHQRFRFHRRPQALFVIQRRPRAGRTFIER